MNLLQANSISKSFAGARALHGVTFDLRPGEVHALVGENGAGKSTLIKIIGGALLPDAGTLEIKGQRVGNFAPAVARALGVAVIYQQPVLFPTLTVMENLALGQEQGGLWRRIDWRGRQARARALLDRVGASFTPETMAGELGMADQQLLEIARALGADARIFIMDEPTAALGRREAGNLLRIIRELRGQGAGIVYISHRLEELPDIADRVTVLRDGEHVATMPMAGLDRAALIRLMVGRDLSAVFPEPAPVHGHVLLETRELSCAAAGVRDVSFTLRAGEILGFAGLAGAGRTQLATTLFGLTPATSGQILRGGVAVQITSPRAAIAHGLAYVPEDRRRHGVIGPLPLTANSTLAVPGMVSRYGFARRVAEQALATRYRDRLEIKTASIHAPVETLSGGNQQKVALSRWLAADPAVMILDEPTQGIDIGAKAGFYELIRDMAARGMGVMLISSDLPELPGLCHRIAVMRGGTIVATLERKDFSQERILGLMLGF
ncbi:MAG: sugar ABC transporter ATP-binding protein [Blastocatellia bacterium]